MRRTTLALLTPIPLLAALAAAAQEKPPRAAELNPPPITEPPTPEPAPRRAADTDEIQARLELARLLAEQSRYDEAIAEYRKVLEAEPERTAARLGLARTLFWAGRTEAAAEVAEAVDPQGLAGEERLFVADLHLSSGAYDEAIALYETHLAAHPDDRQVRHKKALGLAWTERYAAAIEQFEALVAARPEDRQLKRQFAQVLRWADKPERAIEMLQKSLED